MNDSVSTIRIRPATADDADAIGAVHVESWREAYADIVPAPFLAGLSIAGRAAAWRQRLNDPPPGFAAFVAEHERDGVVGFADGGQERGGDRHHPGELYAIYLRAAFHRHAVGRRLVSAVAAHLATAFPGGMLLWVLEQNRARRFYEALGGRELRAQTIHLGGADLVEIAYGWDDPATLIMPAP